MIDWVLEQIGLVWNFIINHPIELVAAILAYWQVFIPLNQYIHQKSLDEQDKRFTSFHKLIENLVDAPDGRHLKIDRQIAIIYELRNYPEYYDLVERLLIGIHKEWKDESVRDHSETKFQRVDTEIRLTLGYIDYKRIWRPKQFINQPNKRISV